MRSAIGSVGWVGLGVLMLAISGDAVTHAESRSKLALVGVVFYQVPITDAPTILQGRALVRGLEENGWIDGRTVRIVWRSAEGRPERIPAMVEELVQMPVDVLVASGSIALESVKRSPALPVVMAASDFPVEESVVASYARPGGSVTGLTNFAGRSLDGKRLALLKEAAPGVSSVAVLGPTLEGASFFPETQAAADSLGLKIFAVTADHPEQLETAFSKAVQSGANGMFVTDYPFAFLKAHQLIMGELAVKHRLPVIHSVSGAAEAGALLSYGPSIVANFRRAADYVDKILRGMKPGDLPIEQPAKVELVVNLKAARAIGLAIPPSIQIQATQVIE